MRVSVLSLAFLGGAAAFAPLPAPTSRVSIAGRVAPTCAVSQNASPILQPFQERRALKVRISQRTLCLQPGLVQRAPNLIQWLSR